jgi:hypothetical protein
LQLSRNIVTRALIWQRKNDENYKRKLTDDYGGESFMISLLGNRRMQIMSVKILAEAGRTPDKDLGRQEPEVEKLKPAIHFFSETVSIKGKAHPSLWFDKDKKGDHTWKIMEKIAFWRIGEILEPA